MAFAVSLPSLVAAQGIPSTDEIPGLEFVVKPGELVPLPLTSTQGVLQGTQGVLEGAQDVLDGRPIEIDIPGLKLAVAPEVLVSSTLSTAATLTQQIVDFGLDSSLIDAGSAPGTPGAGPITVQTVTSALSAFTISGVSRTSHDGFDVKSPAGSGTTASFDSLQYGLTLGVRADASKRLDLKPNTLTFGLFGNVTHTDIDIGSDGTAHGPGGDASVESWSVGGYSLITSGTVYGLVTVIGSFGEARLEDDGSHAHRDFGTDGVVTSAIGGYLIPVSGDTKLDVRAGLNYLVGTGDAYVNSQGVAFGETNIEEVSGNVSVKLFSTMAFENAVVRPFAQGGVTHRFDYSNDARIGGVDFSFSDADTTLVGRLGIDFDVADAVQGHLAVRGDVNEDVETIAGQLGLTVKMN